MRTSLGEQRYKSELMIVLMHTDLPEPVAPAISKCGIFARLHRIGAPAMSLPSATVSGPFALCITSDCSTSLSVTVVRVLLGTSTPTSALPGIGASIRTDLTAMFIAILWFRFVTLLTLMPGAISSSKREIAGPWVMWRTFAGMRKDLSVSSSRCVRSSSSSALTPC